MLKKALLLSLLLLLMVAGCSDDDDNPVDPPETVVLPPDQDALMVEFVQVYQDLDAGRLEELLHPEGRAFLLPSTLAEWEGSDRPLPPSHLDSDTLLTVHQTIFGGQAGVSPNGTVVPPVDTLNVEVFEKVGIWEWDEEPDEVFPGLEAIQCMFHMRLYFNRPDMSRLQVEQDVIFYAVEVTEGESQGWQLLGWRGLEIFANVNASTKATEEFRWGDVLALYR